MLVFRGVFSFLAGIFQGRTVFHFRGGKSPEIPYYSTSRVKNSVFFGWRHDLLISLQKTIT